MLSVAAVLQRYRIGRTDYIVVAGAALVLLIASIGLYLNMTASSGPGGGEVVGTIYFKDRVAQRKYVAQAMWEPLRTGVPVYNNDSIRTGELSAATIVLKDSTRIELDENSMIVVSVGDKTELNFAYGSIQARRDETAGEAGDLTIRSQDRTVTVGASDVQLSKTDEAGGGLDVSVTRGEASVTSASGETQSVGENQRATVNQGRIEIKPVLFRLATPDDSARIFTEGGRASIDFRWAPVEGAVTLEVSPRRNFSQIAARTTINGTASSAALAEGVYYWRISAKNPQSGAVEYSEIRRLAVAQNGGLRLFAPASNASFDYVNDAPLINFSWSRNEFARAYVLEISTRENFSSIAETRELRTTGASVALPAGQYYWRVRSQSDIAGAESTSGASAFRVAQRQRIAAPRPLAPAADRKIAAQAMERGMVFSWEMSPEIRRVSLELAADRNFSQVLLRTNASGGFSRVQRKLEAGDYYWRVRGVDASGTETDYSAVATFSVIQGGRIRLVSPEDGSDVNIIASGSGSTTFQWQRPDATGKFLLEVAADRNFRRILLSRETVGYNVETPNLTPGQYFWRVRLLDAGETLMESDVRAVNFRDSLGTPTLISPAGGDVDLSDGSPLVLRWRPTPGAGAYEVTLVQLGRRPERIFVQRVATEEFVYRDAGNLSSGRYSWSVRACKAGAARDCADEASQTFELIAAEELAAPEFISPSTQYVVPEEN